MLILSRRAEESIIIADTITVKVVSIEKGWSNSGLMHLTTFEFFEVNWFEPSKIQTKKHHWVMTRRFSNNLHKN